MPSLKKVSIVTAPPSTRKLPLTVTSVLVVSTATEPETANVPFETMRLLTVIGPVRSSSPLPVKVMLPAQVMAVAEETQPFWRLTI